MCGRALHWQSLQIRERLGYIIEELKSYDIVGLQEVRTYIQWVCLLWILYFWSVTPHHYILSWDKLLSSNIGRPNSCTLGLPGSGFHFHWNGKKKQGMYVGAKYCHVVTCKVALYQCASFVPSPSHRSFLWSLTVCRNQEGRPGPFYKWHQCLSR